ncbi:diguanylate cyclase [Elizabethkingia meningoseptica]|uniref:GGDEF domain-containing protein n=1 Tax=Elizabethkingia meningoseptica TaxID=238 RepID=UPI0008AA0A67|nr:GGDEF domain-containing protein [Elizabethkingia meningoseptica]MDE5448869.1 GGDEF domain-containing protein [Elizabethkingia meningoseptica]MDE5470870.1 GGDEF domain-containing protein [Elizabethkingia meningoseptica]MDE5519674.1 GGDEF domain-containing protein [Elizabethkingia meningoseptica]MDE5524511.1 GGDEF domain-containing protein [Elizabethkingia meningoseptica]MDE5524669.1 GGDEF domain-containing protein [Elizabethkingia meningoseptica]
MGYVARSYKKFKDDALSKGIYDILKGLFLFLIVLIPSRWIPYVEQILISKSNISVYWILISSVLLIIMTTLFVSYIFKKKIRSVINDNHTDELTGLKNHKALKEYLNHKIFDSKKKDESLSIILLDIDNFKEINTKVGFNNADLLLKKIGELLGNDKRATDETFRYFNRGDEFLVVATETSLNQACQAAERKRKMIQNNLFSIKGTNHKLTVCCGVTELKKEDDYDSFTNRVIEGLTNAKKVSGKNNTQSIV